MPDMRDKVCLNHTSTPAVSRCTTCFKPICGECIKAEGSEDFCSQICIEKHKRTSANIEALKTRKSSGFMKKLIILIILAAAAYGAWKYQDKIKELFNKGKQEINK